MGAGGRIRTHMIVGWVIDCTVGWVCLAHCVHASVTTLASRYPYTVSVVLSCRADLCSLIADRTGMLVISVDYRLAPGERACCDTVAPSTDC